MIGRDPWREVSRVLVFAVAAAILLLSLLPRPPMSFGGLRWSDKIGHLLAYFLWGGLLYLALPGRPADLPVRRLFLTVLIGIGFGGLIELLQPFTGRSRELLDLLSDALGAGGGAVTAYALCRARSAAR